MNEQLLEKDAINSIEDREIDLEGAFQESQIQDILDKLDQELVGLKSVKNKIKEMAALLLVDRIRKSLGLDAGAPSSLSNKF
ncbi:MAG: hypothetical protein PT116_22300 [Aphanizomenon gracile PMC638.10]|nr:hypothetical protein [Aphanizomenon gracile PMC638.10]